MNARNFVYVSPYNTAHAKYVADDKLETKRLLLEHSISTPELMASFEDRNAIQAFDWDTLPERGFVIKPARGYGGGGILPVRKFKDGVATTVTGEELSIDQLISHTYDILEGGFSLQFLPDKVFIEERLVPHQMFRKLGAVGIPDIRVIVFHHIPVMAMIRFPTEKSGGKANISLGALGFGIDMRTGITTGARSKHGAIITLPGTKIKTRGIRLPNWDDLLLLAARTQSVSGLGYAGVDIVLNKDNSTYVLEVNARPGLEIQNINKDSLRARLERIEHIHTPSPERGVEVAKSLFAESFSEKVKSSTKILPVIQQVTLSNKDKTMHVEAKLDTANYRTMIDIKLAEELGLEPTGKSVSIYTESGKRSKPLYKLTLVIAGSKIVTSVVVVDKSHQKYPITIGRLNLKSFVIRPVLHIDNPDEELSDLIES
ncbi:MAG: sugar-transfer associated ATP-grasp domain-containing protein [Patescibacteria group bacterium]